MRNFAKYKYKDNMKTIFKMLFFVLLPFVFASCGDDKPTPVKRKITKESIFEIPIQGIKGMFGTHKQIPLIRLSDIIGEEAAKNILQAEIQKADCYLEVRGLKDLEKTTTLEDFTIQIEGKSAVNLGNCSSSSSLGINDFESDRKQSTDKFLNLIKAIVDTYTHGKKSAYFTLSFMPTEHISLDEDVKLYIVITADYTYNSYQ